MRKVLLGALAALVLVAEPAHAALTFDFTFNTDPYYVDNFGVLTGGFEVTIPYFPVYNASYSGSQISDCSLSAGGNPVSCYQIALYPDTAPLIGAGDIYDAVSIDSPLGGSNFFYFANGAFSSAGSYDNIHMTVDSLNLVISGAADETQPLPGVPEPETWALMLLGLFGAGATFRRAQSKARINEGQFRPA
jgi:hypothetical protein